MKSGEDSNTQKLIDALQKSNLPLKSSALKVLNAINKPTLRQRQLELIELIRADESGSSLAFLIEVANTSPKASKALGDILNATTYNLQKGLKELGMDNIEIRAIYENLKNKTKADYNDVMENVLGKIYDENYKTTIDSKNYLNFRKELEKSGILESDAMAFLKDVEANIYNPNGVEFKQLNNALKRLNAYTKSTNPNLNEHLKSAVRGFLKEDIKKGIDDIFAQNTQGYADSKRLFESALSDYATMKEIFKVKGIKSLMDSTKTKEEAQEAFVRYLKGQGESAKSNYEILTQNLPKEQKENLELGVIQQIFEKSISKGENELKVFDSVLFNKEIEGLKDKFTTKGAKDALELIGGFHRLFSNDGEIAYKLRPPKTGSKGLNSTIATSAEGATKQKMTSAIMDLLMRNLPELGIPFTSVKFNGINERIQGAALRYHLLSALNHSVNVEDFKKILQKRNTPNNFNLPTRELLNSFLKQVDEVKAETLKEAENWRAREAEFEAKKDAMKLSQSIPLKEFGVNYPEYYHNGKGAIEKLLTEAKDYEARKEAGSLTEDEVKQGAYKGQVAGAFYKEGLGDIDLVWGEVTDPVNHKGYGLAHIIDKHPDFDTSLIPEIIEKGNVINQNNIRYRIEKDNYVIGLSAEYKGEKKNFIITAFERYKDKSDTFTEHPFTSTSDNAVKNLENSKANSTTNTQGLQTSLSPFAKAQAEKEAQQEAKEKLQAQQEAQRDLKAKEIAQKQRIIQEQKDAESGQSSLNRNLDLGEKIQTREVKAPLNSVTLGNNEVLELKYVVVKADDLKTNFEGNALQPRTQSNPAVIERIATQFKPNLMIGRGGFEDLPILAPDGQVIAGNHRVEGMKQFNEASRKRYENAIKENFGVELESDELLLRMPKDDLENQKLVSLAFVSNANTNRTFGDRVMASLGKYSKELETIPKYFESQSVDELSTKVAKALEKNGLLPNEEEANLALLGHLAKNSNGENIAKVLTKVYQSNDRETFSKIKDMFVKNAGEFHNLVNDIGEHGLKKLELRPYLLDSINATSQSLRGTRAENFKRLAEKIDNVLKTTTKEGRNDLIESDREFYKNLIGEILGASLAKFARQENPANALYEVLKNAKADLVEALEPTLFKEGKGIENADIYDLLELLISKGEPSEPTSAVIDMLPALREKEEAYNNFIKGSQREGTSHKPQTKDQAQETQTQDIKFVDTKGKEHTLNKDTQKQWLQTFGLQNLEQSYIPKHSQAIQQALGGKEIKLQKGSLLKLVSQGREQYIPQIKEVLDNPEAIIRDSDDGFLFIRHLKNDDFFVNVSYDKGEYLVSISNGIKETRNLKNKLDIGGEIIYQSPSFSSSRNKLLQTSQYSANTIDKENSTIKNTNPIQNTSTLQNPSIEFALQEFPEFSKAELEEMLTKGIRGEARTKEGITKQDIEYIKDNTRYSGEIANYRDEELGMYGDTFHLANLQKTENVIEPTNWEASLKTLLDKALTLGKDKDTLQQAQDLMDSIHLNNPSFFTPLNPNYPKIKEIVNEYQERLNTLIAQSPQDIKFVDTKGKEHTLNKDTQKQWLQTFGLQNLEQSYIPKHSQEIQQALGGKEIRLTKGSLLKLVSKEREQYIPQVKETLDNPDYILKDIDGMIILAKKIDDKQYFTSINLETDDFLISISNAPKKENILKNKVEKGAKIIYQSPNSESIFYTPELLQASQSLANKIDSSNSTIKEQSKQHKGQEELKNIFDEFEQQDKTLQDKAKLLKEHKEDLKSKDLVGSEKWESLMEQQSLLIDEESQILERAYKKAKRLMPHFSSYEEILQYEPINKVSLRLLKENVNEIMDKEIRALQDTSITKADFKQALDEFNTFYKEYRDYHKPLYYEFETKFGFYTREFNKQKLSNAKDVEMFKKHFLDKKPSAFNDKLKQVYETIQQYNQLELQNRQRMHDSKESELITSKAIEIKEQLNNKYKNSIQKQEISKQSENPHAQNFDQATNSKELESGNNLSLMDSAPNLSTKDLIKEAKEQDLSVKETKETITRHKEAEHRYFNEKSPNIYYSNPHLGVGLASGSVAGIEEDENGNISFNAEKFVLGFLGGSLGSKAVVKSLEYKTKKLTKAYPNMATNNPKLFKEVFKKSLSYGLSKNTYNLLTNFFNKNKYLDINLQIFAGEKALLAGEFGPQKKKLKVAKEMKKQGKSELEIWESTGWYKDLDRKWKFEINPNGGRIIWEKMPFTHGQRTTLGQMLKDDELFRAYPSLKDVVVENNEYFGFSYSPKSRNITIGQKTDREDIKPYIYHEIQHAIQHIEDFATGSSSRGDHHILSYGEMEARNIENRMNYGSEKFPHQTSELNQKVRKDNVAHYTKAQKLKPRLEKELKKLEKYIDEYESYPSSANSNKHNRLYEKMQNQNEKVKYLESEIGLYESQYHGWTGEYYKNNKNIKPIVERHSEAFNGAKPLEKAFLDSDNINIEALEAEAVKLPKVLSFREFKEQFRTDGKGNAKVNTRIGEIKINVPKAYNHFVKNTYNVDRKEFSGAFLDTLVNPLFIVRQKYRPKVSLQGKSLQRSNNSLDSKMQNKSRIQIGDKEIIQDSYVFYKPFVNENGLVSLASFAISQNGELLHKTFYDIKTISKLKKLIKGDDEDLLYFKNSNVLLNPQELKTISKIQKTYNFNEAKAKDLYEWHKDSNPITKDKNGLPKVFYHGSWKEFEVFQKELTRDYEMPQGSYFSSNKAVAKQYGETLYESFLKVKNPFIIENFGNTFNDSRDYIIDKIANIDLSKYDSIILKNIKDNPNGSGGKLADTIIIFDSNQIKHIDNQGSYTDIQGNITKEKPKDKEAEHRYFNEKSPNIYYSNPHLGVGLASGSVAGIEEDENGNISFNAEKFVLGMLGGVGGSVSFAKGVKYLKDNPQDKELVAQELSNTLTKGWESAKAKYPLLEALEPRYIIKNEKGRILQSKAILKELFVKEDRILEERLNSFAEPLPKALSKQEFLNQKNRGYNNINTPIGGITINLEHAWEHMNKKNTYKKDRSMYSGAFLDTLTDPLFIVKQEYVPNPKLSANAREMQNSKLVQNKDNQSIAQDSYVFFKPYQLQEKYTYMVGYALDTNGEIINTTFIPMNKRDFGRIKKMLNSNVLYFKERKNDFQYFNEK